MRNWTENQIELLLIRHGATKANQERRYLGKTDEPLSGVGAEKLRRLKAAGKYPEVDALFSSPMKRCLETAEILYPSKRAVIVPEWEETDFGAFEGKNYRELQGDQRYRAWIDSGGRLPFPEGESREEFIDRCKRGFDRMLNRLSEMTVFREATVSGENPASREMTVSRKNPYSGNRPLRVGMIVHGGTIMALLSSFCGGDYYDYQAPNGGGYLCAIDRGVPGSDVSENDATGGGALEHGNIRLRDLRQIGSEESV